MATVTIVPPPPPPAVLEGRHRAQSRRGSWPDPSAVRVLGQYGNTTLQRLGLTLLMNGLLMKEQTIGYDQRQLPKPYEVLRLIP